MSLPKLSLLAASLVVLSSLSGCQKPDTSSQAVEIQNSTPLAATVNGVKIHEGDVFDLLAIKQENPTGLPMNPTIALNELINMEILVQEAEKTGLDKREDIARSLRRQRSDLLVTTLLQDTVEGFEISDADLKAEYDAQMELMPAGAEYKARHILLDTEDEAKAVITELDNGSDFQALAKERSTGPSGPRGGDLGWFSPDSMVAPFSEAVQNMEKGTFSKAPTQTRFGWHVILLEDSREKAKPSFESVKDRLDTIVMNKKLQAYIIGLREAANVEVVDSTGTLNTASPEKAPAAEADKAEPKAEEPAAPVEKAEPKAEEAPAEKAEPEAAKPAPEKVEPKADNAEVDNTEADKAAEPAKAE